MSEPMTAMHIVYATDDGYLLPTFVAAASALAWASARERIVIDVLDTGITTARWEELAARLRERFGMSFGLVRHVVDLARLSGIRKWHGSVGAYARLLLPEILADAPWCVYCDGDTLFTDDPLKLEAVFDSQCAIQGHEDWDVSGGRGMTQEKWFEEKGLGWDPAQYVCSGFLLMNLDWFRANDGERRCLDFIAQHPDINFPDQDALCYVCRGHIGRLPDRWGRFSWSAFREGMPGCLHYASDLPWKLMTNLYRDYNDAHRLWFVSAEKLLGLTMEDVLVGGLKRGVWYRKLAWRQLFKTLAVVVRAVPALARTGFGDYCLRHYASRRDWERVVGGMAV